MKKLSVQNSSSLKGALGMAGIFALAAAAYVAVSQLDDGDQLVELEKERQELLAERRVLEEQRADWLSKNRQSTHKRDMMALALSATETMNSTHQKMETVLAQPEGKKLLDECVDKSVVCLSGPDMALCFSDVVDTQKHITKCTEVDITNVPYIKCCTDFIEGTSKCFKALNLCLDGKVTKDAEVDAN